MTTGTRVGTWACSGVSRQAGSVSKGPGASMEGGKEPVGAGGGSVGTGGDMGSGRGLSPAEEHVCTRVYPRNEPARKK